MNALPGARPRMRRTSVALLALTLLGVVAAPAPVAANESTTSQARRVMDIAKAQLHDRWAFAAIGPDRFDCSGLVFFSFREAGLLDLVGGKRKTVRTLYQWFNNQGKADKIEGKPGDLIVWGRNKHVGIYLGDGMAVSALVNPHGVSIHPVKGYLGMPLKAYLHVGLEQ